MTTVQDEEGEVCFAQKCIEAHCDYIDSEYARADKRLGKTLFRKFEKYIIGRFKASENRTITVSSADPACKEFRIDEFPAGYVGFLCTEGFEASWDRSWGSLRITLPKQS
jgi:hypothetical protein